ncbi:MAG: hypothetical protein CUN53_19390, partial [Phototrophicales bacterium]
MATGQLPFQSDDIPALLMQHVRQQPPLPRSLVPELPMSLETVILKALEKNPSRRFQSGEAMAAALRAAVPTAEIGRAASDWDTESTTHHSTPAIARTATGTLPPPPLRVLLADDHTMLRRSLANLLAQRDDVMVIGEAADGESALQQTLELQPDVLVLDLNMPKMGGLDVLPL